MEKAPAKKTPIKKRIYQVFKVFYKMTGQDKKKDAFYLVEQFSQKLHPFHFNQKDISKEDMKKFFSKQLCEVEIETHAYCNRTCSFCPNSFINRREKDKIMSGQVFEKIIDELKAINYNETVKLHRYNEPLSHDLIFDR